jgi:hypothetical protein
MLNWGLVCSGRRSISGSRPSWPQLRSGIITPQARVYHDVIVQVSNDPEFRTGVRTLYNNDGDNSAHLGKGTDPAYIETNRGRVIDAKGETARYVRLYSSGNTSDELNHYCEVEVYGESAK